MKGRPTVLWAVGKKPLVVQSVLSNIYKKDAVLIDDVYTFRLMYPLIYQESIPVGIGTLRT